MYCKNVISLHRQTIVKYSVHEGFRNKKKSDKSGLAPCYVNQKKMKVKKVEAIIEKASDGGYGIYIPSIPGIGVIGDTEEEAKSNLLEVISDIVDQCKKDGVKDTVNGGNLDITYRYDPSAFFKTFKIFNVSYLAKTIGVNSSLMRQYKSGKTYISEARKKQIEKGIHQLADELLHVKF